MQNEMCNMYMMVTSEVPYFMTCGNGYSGVSLAGPGGMHPDSALTPELPARWRPPPARNAAAKAEHLLGQVSGAEPPPPPPLASLEVPSCGAVRPSFKQAFGRMSVF